MNKPTLYVLVGLSGSGKSTVATQIINENPNTVIVSTDAVREELTGDEKNQSKNEIVFKIFHRRIREYLIEGINVVADATNLTMKSRRAIVMNTLGLNINKICCVIVKRFERCKIDNNNRLRVVPEGVIEKQLRSFQIPFKEEGWNEIFLYNFVKGKQKCISEMREEMKGFDQKNPHHNMDLYEHSILTYENFIARYNYSKEINTAALLHDYGKLYTQTFDKNGVAHYFEHPSVSSYYILENLIGKHKDNMILNMCFLANYHMMPFWWMTEKAKQRWKKRFGEYKYQMLLDFNECDTKREEMNDDYKDRECYLRQKYEHFIQTKAGQEWKESWIKQTKSDQDGDFGDYLYDFYPEMLL